MIARQRAPLNIPNVDDLVVGKVIASLAALLDMNMKTQRQSTRLALRLDAEEATRWCRLVGDDPQDQRGAEQILQIDDAAD